MAFLRMMIGWYRVWLGFCPSCKSQAPAIDTCPVCRVGWKFDHEFHSKDHFGRNIPARWKRFVERGYR